MLTARSGEQKAAIMSDYPVGTLGRLLIDFHILPPIEIPGPHVSLTQFSLKPGDDWEWRDTQVLTSPDALNVLHRQLAQSLDLNHPVDAADFANALRECSRQRSVANETEVSNRIQRTFIQALVEVFSGYVPPTSALDVYPSVAVQGIARPDVIMKIDGVPRWCMEIKTVTSGAAVLAAAYHAASTGFFIRRVPRSNAVFTEGLHASLQLQKDVATIMKQVGHPWQHLADFKCTKYMFSLNLPHLLLTDGATYQLVSKHPSQPIIFLAPPISNAGLVGPMAGPILCTHKPLGLAVALCARGDVPVLSVAELALTINISTAPGRPSTRLTNVEEITASAVQSPGEGEHSQV
jgi:hypothetical protein